MIIAVILLQHAINYTYRNIRKNDNLMLFTLSSFTCLLLLVLIISQIFTL